MRHRHLVAPRAAILLPLGLATLTLLWHLGASSLFVDETFSWRAASASLGGVFSHVQANEVAPPGYYLLLHAWIGAFGDATESSMRLLSVLAGLALVAAVYWLAMLLAGVRLALLAGLMSAISPLVVLYAQQVRAYVFAMLSVTLAVATAVQATRDPAGTCALAGGIRSRLHRGDLAALHRAARPCTAVGIRLDPRPSAPRSAPLPGCVRCRLRGHRTADGHSAAGRPSGRRCSVRPAHGDERRPRRRHAFRWASPGVHGDAAPRRSAGRRRDRVAAAALSALRGSPSGGCGCTAAPVTVLAWWIITVPRPWGAALAVATLIAALSSLIPSYSIRQPNLRGAFARIASDYHIGDGLLVAAPVAADYYLARLRRAHRPLSAQREVAAADPPRLWVLADPGSAAAKEQALHSARWRTSAQARFAPAIELLLETH